MWNELINDGGFFLVTPLNCIQTAHVRDILRYLPVLFATLPMILMYVIYHGNLQVLLNITK